MNPPKDYDGEPPLTDDEIRWLRHNRKLIESFGLVGGFFRRIIIGAAGLIIAIMATWNAWVWFISKSSDK